MTEMAIEAQGLVKTYPKGVRALDGVSFDVEAGSVFGLVGPNGAGKSTTVKILTTLSRPDSGAGRGGRHRRAAPARRRAPRDRLRGAEVGRRRARHGAREPAAAGPPVRHGRPRRSRSASTPCSSASAWPTRRAASPAPTRAACSASSTSRWAWSTPRGAVSGRADDRPRPRGPRRHVDRDRAPRRRGRAHHPAHHALPRGGRPAGAAPGDRRPGQGRGAGHARGAQERAARRRRARRARRAPRPTAASAAALAQVWPTCATWRSSDGRLLHARADNGARAVPVMLQALEAHGVRGRLGHRRAALARRRLSEVHRPALRSRPTRPRR